MLKVIRRFYDRYEPETIFSVNQYIDVEDAERRKDLIARGLVVESKDKVNPKAVHVLKALEERKPKAPPKKKVEAKEEPKGAE